MIRKVKYKMLKTFALIGMVCFADNNQWGENCFNIWEQPTIHYKSLNDCDNAGKKLVIQLRREATNNGLTITSGELWCVETTKGQNS